MFVFSSRQKEMEERLIEEEVAKRVEALVAQRVAEELEKRKDEIEAEVLRRVDEAKREMEQQMLEEMEQKREAEILAQKKKEVGLDTMCARMCVCVSVRACDSMQKGMRAMTRVNMVHQWVGGWVVAEAVVALKG